MYTREQRFEALALADPAELEAAADRLLADHAVEILREPTAASVMMRAVETAEGSVFNLGEVAVTEAEVVLGGERGYALVMGFEPVHALAAAVVDAAFEALPDAREGLTPLLRRAFQRAEAQRDADWAMLAPTRVAFDELPQ